MTTLRERIASERRRMRTVRQLMAAGIERGANGDDGFVSFYIAAADYIDEAMSRLHVQDVRMGEMIRAKVDVIDAGVEKALGQLDERLAGAQAHLEPFLAARDELKQHGVDALANFERQAAIYSDFIASNMGHHGATTDLSAKLFDQSDWEHMAAVTDAQQRQEQALYSAVEAAIPSGVTLTADE